LERRRLKADLHALVSPELERMGFLAAFTERTGGVSRGPFSSLNLGSETGDHPDLVGENWRRVGGALGTREPVSARQVHGTRLHPVEGPVSDVVSPVADADGLTTRDAGVPLAVMVADCVPLVLASGAEELLAAVHVGWRGLAAGIVQVAVRSFSGPASVAASIGPSVGPCHYEVGQEVVDQVVAGTEGEAVVARGGSGLRLDLASSVEAVLGGLGVRTVDRAGECTACDPVRFFSHRRDGTTGRQALVAMRL
jgi:hypothetical protein